MCRSLTAELGGLAGRGCRAAVLTGRGFIFSAGADLLRLRDGGPGYLDEFLPALSAAFLAVFDCPVPVIAATLPGTRLVQALFRPAGDEYSSIVARVDSAGREPLVLATARLFAALPTLSRYGR